MSRPPPAMTVAERLARFAAGLPFDSLPPDVVDSVRLRMLDTLGLALAGSRAEFARAVLGVVDRERGACTVIGTARTAPAHPRTQDYIFGLRLSLPTGTLNATGEGATVRLSVKYAFSDIESQVKKHQSKLRREHEWKRKRPRKAIA